MKRILSLAFCLSAISAIAQSDLIVGPNFKVNIQRQDNDADAFILHNAKVDASPGLNFRWDTSHPSFGTRGIYFGYLDGIKFFADNASTTGGALFSPTTRMFIGNSGSVGIGTTSPGAYSRLNVVGGAVEISNAPHNADASLHISTSYGQFDRLTQINPSLDNKPALNLMASRGGPGVYNWWAWGVLTSGAWALQPSTSFGGSTGLFINPNGNTGIGTINPTQKLEVNGSILQNAENTAFGVDNIGDSRLGFLKKAGYVPVIASSSGSSIIFSQTNQPGIYSNIAGATLTERMRIDANGTVGINTATPAAAYKLDVNGIINSTGLYVNGAPFSSGGSAWLLNGSSMYYNSGPIGIGTSTPSSTYKLDVNGIINATGLYLNGQPFAAGSSAWQLSGSNLYYTSGNLGIGTPSPVSKVQINASSDVSNALRLEVGAFSMGGSAQFQIDAVGTAAGRLVVKSNGYVGIGTASPDYKLTVKGSGGTSGLKVINNNEIYQTWGLVINQEDDLKGSINSQGRDLQIQPGWDKTLILGSTQMQANGGKIIFPGGNVGIGTSNPNQKLTVNGTIYGKEVKVDLSVPGPDYVFANNYQLQPLSELKTYIDQNKHLPEVPSAAAMEANGINLGEMNMLLLKKIEELTLYILEQEKRINRLEKK